MKKHLLQFVAISGLFFFTACSDSTAKETKQDSNSEPQSGSTQTADTVKKTTISVSSNAAGVKTKNTEVQVNSGGVKVGTTDVKVDVKTGK